MVMDMYSLSLIEFILFALVLLSAQIDYPFYSHLNKQGEEIRLVLLRHTYIGISPS